MKNKPTAHEIIMYLFAVSALVKIGILLGRILT